eukprot:scaffold95767_cov60-Phaeocystis_antarctica.AAC.2
MVPDPSMSANIKADCAVCTTNERLAASAALESASRTASVSRISVAAAVQPGSDERDADTEPVWKCEPVVQPSVAEHQNMPPSKLLLLRACAFYLTVAVFTFWSGVGNHVGA